MASKRDRLKKKLIESLEEMPIVQIACQRVGVARATYYRWVAEDRDFQNDIESAIIRGRGMVNDLAESQVVSGIKEGKPSLIMYWLNHNHPVYSKELRESESSKHLIAAAKLDLELSNFRQKVKAFLDDDYDDELEPSSMND